MVRVRGIMLVEAIGYVHKAFGPEAHERVLAALTPAHRLAFDDGPREAAWVPIEDFLAYLEQAKRLLAPDDPTFFRRLGAAAGSNERHSSGFRPLLETPEVAMRMGNVAWRSFYEGADIDFTLETPRRARVRLGDLPVSRALCERHVGAWGPLLSSAEWQASVTELSCRALGAASCEFRVEWLPQPSAGGSG